MGDGALRDAALANSELPRERLRREGARALATGELLALILRTGGPAWSVRELAETLLHRFGTLDGLARAGDAELADLPGMGPAKTAALRAALELGARRTRAPLVPGARLGGPEHVWSHLSVRLRGVPQEVFTALLLDARHRLIREVEVSRGSLNQSLVHPREVFGPAVREAAASLIVAHNHPSGDPRPSREDHDVTRRLERAGRILGIPLLDHVVIGAQGYTSFARSGWLNAQGPEGSLR